MARILNDLGCDITIIGRRRGTCCNNQIVPYRIKRFRMLFKKGFLFYKFFNLRLFFYLILNKSDVLVANDLDTLLPNFLVSRIKKLPLVYDSHEYFTGVPELQSRPFVRWVWKSIESRIFPKLQYVVTVSDSIAELYEREYKLKPVVVRNCSHIPKHLESFSRKDLDVPEDHLMVILQGTGINVDRGGEELIEAVSMTGNVSLLVVGTGDAIEKMKAMSQNIYPVGRVRFIPVVPWELMIKYTRAADVGVTLDKDTNINYRFSLPNKLFDYIAAGIPVIASDLKEVEKIIVENHCGIIISSVTPENISQAFTRLHNNRPELDAMKRNAKNASAYLNWENESKLVIELYSEVLRSIHI
jgi:glycosyltransferase involved in cell wall biosynthesis